MVTTNAHHLAATIALAIVIAVGTGCTRAGGTPEPEFSVATSDESRTSADSTRQTSQPDDAKPADTVEQLERLRAAGRFEEFIDDALKSAASDSRDAAIQALHSEALLATGRLEECEDSAVRTIVLAQEGAHPAVLVQALKLWTTARFRQGKSLDDPKVRGALSRLPDGDPSVELLSFWSEMLAGRPCYRLEAPGNEQAELTPADAARGSVPFELAAIQATANGATMPLVFVDTGAQYTLMTAAAAKAAGIIVGPHETQLVGFAPVKAQPGLIETLKLGDLVIHDVPVVVGNSAPLLALGGQMSLGTELMQHVRFHIDYPTRRVTAEPANRAAARAPRPPLWEIPVWTFSQVCLARGQRGAGPLARVLVDTGNRAGTFVSYRWARRHMPGLAAPSSLVFRLKKRKMTLDLFDLGSQSLIAWPVADTLPPELDRLNLVDVIVGHDLLWPYELTIDLPRRVLELRAGGNPTAAGPAVADNDDGSK
jgi:hypothetical protein